MISRLDEAGIITKFIHNHISPKDLDNSSKDESGIKPFNIEQILGAFLFWLICLTLCSIVLFFEMANGANARTPRKMPVENQIDTKSKNIMIVKKKEDAWFKF